MNRSDHRLRYRLLSDRRRLGFERERLWTRLSRHRSWPSLPVERRDDLEASLDVRMRPATGEVPELEADVRAMTACLVTLARAWYALEHESAATERP